jgi:hypothetical protein
MCNWLKCNEQEDEEAGGKRREGALVGHHICYKESARNLRDLKFATQRSFVLLIEVG